MRVSLLLTILLLVVNIVSDIYIAKQLPQSFRKGVKRVVLWVINSTVYTLFIIILLLVYSKNIVILTSNIELLVFIFFTLTFPKLIFVLISPFDYLLKTITHKKSKPFTIIGVILSITLVLILLYGFAYGRKHIICNNVEVTSPLLPKSFDGFKIIHISDLHLKSFYGDTLFLSRMVKTINDFNPDIVCFTGDIVSLKADEILPYKGVLSLIKAKKGVFSVLGNHDYGDYVNWKSVEEKSLNIQELTTYQKEMGWTLLNNSYNNIGSNSDTISVIGVENWGKPPFSQYGNLSASYPTLFDDKFKILLSHNPEHWEEVLDKSNINLTLSGHTHAMQLKLPFKGGYVSPASLRGKWWSGLYKDGEQYLYVNDGIGCTLFTFRMGAFPEITVITLKRKNE
ncbi:MAG: metallophosphoesterase [Bacteroidales bacterium]|nr:metallophosphoesterase [Bacteroidales bacterium]